jgi:hypothetical protein
MNSTTLKLILINIIYNDIEYIIMKTMSINKTRDLTPFINIYRGMKIIINKNLYPKIRIVMEHLVMSNVFHSQNLVEFNMII